MPPISATRRSQPDACFTNSNAWLASTELEIDNYRAALEWALTQENDAVVGGAIAGSLGDFWIQGGLDAEGRYWVGPALERVSEAEQPHVVARLWLAAAILRYGKQGCEAAEQAIRLYDALGDDRRVGRAQQHLVFGLLEIGRPKEAREVNARTLAASRERGDRAGVAVSLNRQGWCERVARNFKVGREHYAQALAAFRALENDTWAAMTLDDLAALEFEDGHTELALRLADEALEIKLRQKHAIAIAVNYTNSAAYRLALGEFGGARESALQGLRWARQVQDPTRAPDAIQYLAVLVALGGDVQRATRLMGYVDAQYQAAGRKRKTTDEWSYEGFMSAPRERLGEAEIATLAAEGSLWSEDQATAEALLV